MRVYVGTAMDMDITLSVRDLIPPCSIISALDIRVLKTCRGINSTKKKINNRVVLFDLFHIQIASLIRLIVLTVVLII